MKIPQLPADEYLKDRIRSRALIFQPGDFSLHTHSPVSEGFAMLDGNAPLRISLPCAELDLSHFNRLVLTVCNLSEEPILAGMTLRHGAGADDRGLSPVSFSGGREILHPGRREELKFPIECFGFYGRPCGWKEVCGIELTFTSEKGRKEAGRLKIALRSLFGEARELPPGPRLTAGGLEKMLRTEVSREAARERGSDRFSSRREPGFRFPGPYHSGNPAILIPPPHPYPREDAEAILKGQIMGQSVPSPVPWGFNPLGAHEWTHFLNRHHFLRELVIAFARTGEPRYVDGLDHLISSWITGNPAPLESDGGAGPAWETLSTAWRLREWLWVAGVVWPSGAFSRETRNLMLRSLWEHARSLMDHRGHPGNWVLVESAALALAGICFPEFREAPVWAAEGLSRLSTECERQFFADGAHCEMSPLYHAICLHAMIEVKEAVHAAGYRLPDLFGDLPVRAAEYLAALCRPDFTWPSFNDSGGVPGDYTALLRKAGEIFGLSDLLWIGTRGREGPPSPKRSQVFPDAGVVVMSAAQGNFLVFRAGPPGTAHRHEDLLALDVTALGIPRLVDPGITTYAPVPLTSWYRSKAAHNLLLIDPGKRILPEDSIEKAKNPGGPRLFFRRQGLIEAAIGTFGPAGAGETAGHGLTRSVVFVNGEYWVVKDDVSGPSEVEASTCWQFYPGRVEKEGDAGTTRCVTPGVPGFELSVLPGPVQLAVEMHAGSSDPPCGWVSINGRDVPAAHLRYRWKTAPPATVFWLLVPYEGNFVSGVKADRTDLEDGTFRICVIFPTGCCDTITFRPPTGQPQRGDRSHGKIEFTRRSGKDPAYNAALVF